ncbi:hypothetical protein [Nocardia sp. NPDC127526]|uniref:hypothetical protein n=1 Tax=Nocardia sp. NPDC127526 TaxID=3345393 RepID=UPI00362F6518
MTISLSSIAIPKASFGVTELHKISIGSTQVWASDAFTPVRANIATGHISTYEWKRVIGLTADTASYPGSTVTSDQLVVPAAGTGVTITASIRWENSKVASYPVSMRLKVDGVIVKGETQFDIGAKASKVCIVEATNQTVRVGSLVTVESTNDFVTGPVIVADVASNFLRVTKL